MASVSAARHARPRTPREIFSLARVAEHEGEDVERFGVFRVQLGRPREDLPRLVVPFKRDVYERIVAELGHLAE
jgi:hypothetical protein